jgi:hypothetical protein
MDLPYTRSVVMPPSPPKNSGNIRAIEATSSPMPRVIMAKVVPDFLVVTKPSRMANSMPARPPTKGMSTSGMGMRPSPARFMAWMARNEPSPVYTACPKLSMPPCPSRML